MIDISKNGKWHIPQWKVAYLKMESGIYQNGKWHMPKWTVAYTRVESGKYQSGMSQIYMWNISMFSLDDQYCIMMIDIDAGLCSQARAQTQAFPTQCLDESFAFQCVNLVPQAWASNGLLDFTVSTSYQPSCTVTHKGWRQSWHMGSHVY